MSESNEILPEGIYLNKPKDELGYEMLVEEEIINSSKCPKCDITFQSILYTDNGRHSGEIVTQPNKKSSWKNNLPKDRVRCIKVLNEALVQKLDTHIKRHNND